MDTKDTRAALAEARRLRDGADQGPFEFDLRTGNLYPAGAGCDVPLACVGRPDGNELVAAEATAAMLAAAPDLITLAERVAEERDAALAELAEARAIIAAEQGLPEGAVSERWRYVTSRARAAGFWVREFPDHHDAAGVYRVCGIGWEWRFDAGPERDIAPTAREAMRDAEAALAARRG